MIQYLQFYKATSHIQWHTQAMCMHAIRNKMAAPGYVYTLEDKLCVPSEAVRIGLPPALVSLRFRYVRVSSYMTGLHRCLVSSARSAQKFGGKKKKKKNMKKNMA